MEIHGEWREDGYVLGPPSRQPVHDVDRERAAETVYMLGAGFNCAIPTLDGWHAPLAKDTFRRAIEGWHPSRSFDNYPYTAELLAYIHHSWGLRPDDLAHGDFDIEECMSLIQLQRLDLPREAVGLHQLLLKCEYAVMAILRGHLTDAWHQLRSSPALARWAEEVYDSGSTVITFNYDTFAEQLIESASGMDLRWSTTPNFEDFAVPDHWLGYSRNHFNYARAYGFPFHYVELSVAGGAPKIDGATYYAHEPNSLYTRRRVLKLHGSVNWLASAGEWMRPSYFTPEVPEPQGLILSGLHEMFFLNNSVEWNGWRVEPVVITPQVFKRTNAQPFAFLWQQARDALARCRRLVIIGYSLPPTDFAAVRLLLEAFADNRIEELTIINPDENAPSRFARLIRPKEIRHSPRLHEYYGLPEVDEFGRLSQERQEQLPKMTRQPLVRDPDNLRPWPSYWDEAATQVAEVPRWRRWAGGKDLSAEAAPSAP